MKRRFLLSALSALIARNQTVEQAALALDYGAKAAYVG